MFAGWRNDLPDMLAAMDLFVLPSWREGVPRSAIEAAAMGLPLVLTDIRGCREIVRDGQEGLLVPPRDPGRLAEAIGALVREPEERARMGKAAHARARDRSTVSRSRGRSWSTPAPSSIVTACGATRVPRRSCGFAG